MPQISVIVPTHNYGRYLREAVHSIQAQEGNPDIEIIVVNNGSTDNTPEVLATIDEPRMRVITHETNRGPGAAYNAGLDAAAGEYVAVLDADDRWRPGKLKHQLAVMEADADLAVVFSDLVRFNSETEEFYPQTQFAFFPELEEIRTVPTRTDGAFRIVDPFATIIPFTDWPAWLQVMLFRRSAIGSIRMPLDMRVLQDTQFCLKVFREGAVAFTREVVVEVRRHGANLTNNADELEEAKPVLLKSLEAEDLTAAERAALRRRIGRALVDSGRLFLRRNRKAAAAKKLVQALSYPGFRSRAMLHLASIPLHVVHQALKRARH
jgi:glycosyltransferase involved in cell wall biosynthesis